MTREEAIQCIKHELLITVNRKDLTGQAIGEALDMAIDALLDRSTEEEDQLKFYYVESEDDYWIGMRVDNFYYADWHEGLGFVWSKSRYLPWGEYVVDEKTIWKEHTYPSEPVEIPFTEWITGFVKKYFADRPTGKWIIKHDNYCGVLIKEYFCDQCGERGGLRRLLYDPEPLPNFCGHCGADMRAKSDNERSE